MDYILNNTVQELRTEAGMTQQALGDAVGVTRQTIIALERGNYVPSLLLALRLSAFFERNVEDIFTLT